MTHVQLQRTTAEALLRALETDAARGETLIRPAFSYILLAELRATLAQPADFQQRAVAWVRAAFGTEPADCKEERAHRFLEESLELVQAAGVSAGDAHALVEYVYQRPAGEFEQEVGGVLLTLAPLAAAHGVRMEAAGEAELARVNSPAVLEKCRRKNASKPRNSPLPGTDDSSHVPHQVHQGVPNV